MGSKKTDVGSAKRYGARYGRMLRIKLSAVEMQHRTRQKCPYCNKIGAKRDCAGIWTCLKCSKTFTGRAYSVK